MKTILITGSSRWIWRAIALQASKQGYQVILHGRTDSDALRSVGREIPSAVVTYFDIADKNAVNSAIGSLIEQFWNIDILVNNAWIAENFVTNIEDIDDEKALHEWRVNVLGTIHCIQAVLSSMKSMSGGNIINISSIKWHPNLSTMSTCTFAQTKAAVQSLTKSVAKTYAQYGIRVNSISPWYTETDQVQLWNEETFSRINNGTLLGRIASPD